jgi:hypothetical protein
MAGSRLLDEKALTVDSGKLKEALQGTIQPGGTVAAHLVGGGRWQVGSPEVGVMLLIRLGGGWRCICVCFLSFFISFLLNYVFLRHPLCLFKRLLYNTNVLFWLKQMA